MRQLVGVWVQPARPIWDGNFGSTLSEHRYLRTVFLDSPVRRDIRSQIVDLALDQPELSPRELAVRFTDEQEYFVSEASVYRLLKAHDLITSPAYIVIKAE